ncbi:MAG: hypothetical protein GX465_06025 [Acidobacteria bacterium]|nr:hypothetical protein [Acidobacteriota bacterium]
MMDDPENHYRAEEQIKCVFYSLVVRNEAVKKKWRARLKDYWRRYGAVYNDDITATCFMGPYWDEQYGELIEKGLEAGRDFVLFDASNVILEKDGTAFPFKTGWIGGYVYQAGVMIFLRH